LWRDRALSKDFIFLGWSLDSPSVIPALLPPSNSRYGTIRMPVIIQRSCAGIMLMVLGCSAGVAQSNGMDPAQHFSWGENIGWVDSASPVHTLTVWFNGEAGWLDGFAWGENIGWIRCGAACGGPYTNTAADDWGVNIGADGRLSGYAWGENVGWINFEDGECNAWIDLLTGGFQGHAWGENVGWIAFGGPESAYHARTLAFDTQPMGTPNWWLAWHAVTESSDEGDGFPAHLEFDMDTDPNDVDSHLRIVAVNRMGGTFEVVFRPGSPRRYYTLTRQTDLFATEWESVPGQVGIRGTGSDQSMQDDAFDPTGATFYRIRVSASP
jgi:hypothetical protein